ncbi:MAG TPA: hypothetical protein VHI13_22395 [Candidatus Kapabacteria bacterium]|nr:hypothetical protein [Candidatus Kapabacteria bacterium]
MRRRTPLKIARIVLIACVVVLGVGLVVMALWNALIPVLFAGPVINYWQALGLFILSRILLMGRGGPPQFSRMRHERWRRKFEERMASMSPEDRERMRRAWDERCGRDFDGPRWKQGDEHAEPGQ